MFRMRDSGKCFSRSFVTCEAGAGQGGHCAGNAQCSRRAHLVQVALHVFKDEEQLIVFPDHLLQLDDARMVQLLERLPPTRPTSPAPRQLALRPAPHARPPAYLHLPQLHALLPRVELLLHLLDRNLPPRGVREARICARPSCGRTTSPVDRFTALMTVPYVPSPSVLVAM